MIQKCENGESQKKSIEAKIVEEWKSDQAKIYAQMSLVVDVYVRIREQQTTATQPGLHYRIYI